MIGKTLIGALCMTAMLAAASDTRLADAAQRGDKDAVRSLLKQKADVNGSHGDGATALHWAAYNDDLDTVKLLLAAGANVNAATREGAITPLFMACTNGDAAMVEELIKAGADAKAVKSNGTTALMVAAASGSADTVKVLLDHGALINFMEGAYGQTALMFAAAMNRAEVIKLLTSRGADINVTTTVRKLERVRFDQDGNIVEDRPGRAPAAAAGGAPDAKAEDTAKEQLNTFAHAVGLKEAAYRPGNVKHATRAGDVAFRGPRKVGADYMGGMTALLYAAREGHKEAVEALVDAGADVNMVSAGDRISPMLEAIINGHYDLAKYLLEHGADPNATSLAGLAPLYATIDVQWAPKTWYPEPNTEQEKTTHLELMKALIAKGANVNAQLGEKQWFRSFTNDYTWIDPAGATPFWRAAQSSDLPAMHLLADHGADPKIKSKAGDTPLLVASGIGWAWNWSLRSPYPALDAVKYCVELGNDVNAADQLGYTPLHGAAYLGDNEMITFLVSKGAMVDAKSRQGDSVADMANGPTRFGQPHPETVAMLEKLGSPNSHNCRSDQCVVAARSQVYQMSPADLTQKEQLDKFAASIGLQSVEYRADVPQGRGFGQGGRAASESAPPAQTPEKKKPGSN